MGITIITFAEGYRKMSDPANLVKECTNCNGQGAPIKVDALEENGKVIYRNS